MTPRLCMRGMANGRSTGGRAVAAHQKRGKSRAFNPASGTELEPDFGAGNESDVDRACMLAQSAFDSYRETSLETRAQFLRLIAKEIRELGNALVDRASAEEAMRRIVLALTPSWM